MSDILYQNVFKKNGPPDRNFHRTKISVTGPTLDVLQATHNTAPMQSSSLSRIQILQQPITYPNLAAVYHVSKPCSSLSRIQTLQQSFRYPNLAGSSLEDVPQVHQITDFKLCYARNTNYDSVVDL